MQRSSMKRLLLPLAIAFAAVIAIYLFWFANYNRQSIDVPSAHSGSQNTVAPMHSLIPPRPLPEVQFIDESGQRRTLADYQGSIVLLNIWATWCPPCRREMPSLDRLQSLLGGEEFIVLPISIDQKGVGAVKAFYQHLDIASLGVFVDDKGETERQLKIPGLPTTMLLNRLGNAIGVTVGPMEWDSEEVIMLMKEQINPSI